MADLSGNPGDAVVGVGTSEANSEAVSFHTFRGMRIHVPTGETATSLTFFAVDRDGDEANEVFTPCYDTTNAVVTLPVAAGRNYPIPDNLWDALKLKIVANAISGGTKVNYRLTMKG